MPLSVPTTPGLFVPPVAQNAAERTPSVLLGLKRPGDAIEEEGEEVEAEDFAWGMLRGMGWKGDAESEISKHRSRK